MTPTEERVYKKVLQRLKEDLRVEVCDGGFTDPNSRKLVVTLNGDEVCYAYFDVVQKREYEG
jgi:hypothetical protein